MNKETALKDAKETFSQSLANIEAAQKICNAVDSLLPQGWHSKFFGGEHLEFCPLYPHKASSAEFRMVCHLVEKATGEKLDRHARGDKSNPRLVATKYYQLGSDDDVRLVLWVESSADDTCKIVYKRTWEMKAIADERCLGLNRQEARDG